MRASRVAPGVALAACLGLAVCAKESPADRDYRIALQHFRIQKDQVFVGDGSPLAPEQRAAFRGLRYYAPDPRWVVEARLEAGATPDTLQFPTSKQTFDPYVRLGRLRFDWRGRPLALTLYRAVDSGQLFLPFLDHTSGRDTYGAGRYLDLELQPDGRTSLDFNRAYNPYCAYNAGWICPLAPSENTLDVAVEAGEKVFEDGH